MSLRAEERQALIADLTTNCDCWKGQGDRALLETLQDDKLISLKEHFDPLFRGFDVDYPDVKRA